MSNEEEVRIGANYSVNSNYVIKLPAPYKKADIKEVFIKWDSIAIEMNDGKILDGNGMVVDYYDGAEDHENFKRPDNIWVD